MEAIYKRVSIRAYKDTPIEEEKINEILKAGMQAPSAGGQQPWEFFVVTNKDVIFKLSRCHAYANCAEGAAAVIVPLYRKRNLRFPEFVHCDMAVSMENMWLTATELGLGGVWLGIAPVQERMDAVRDVLELPPNLEAFCLFPLGYSDEEKEPENRYDVNKIHYIK